MATISKLALTGLMALVAFDVFLIEAHARGGGSNFMNSPGYQRRLQESRGYVTNQSGSIVSRPVVVAPPPVITPRARRRR